MQGVIWGLLPRTHDDYYVSGEARYEELSTLLTARYSTALTECRTAQSSRTTAESIRIFTLHTANLIDDRCRSETCNLRRIAYHAGRPPKSQLSLNNLLILSEPMSIPFPMYQEPTLASWLKQVGANRAETTVKGALASESTIDSETIDALCQSVRFPRIELSSWKYLEEPWIRTETQRGNDISALRQGIYDGDVYTIPYTQYVADVVSGAEMVSLGANSGHRFDPMFAFYNNPTILIRAANDTHREDLIARINDHVERANKQVDKWNDDSCRSVVEREITKQIEAVKREESRTADLAAAGFEPASKPAPKRVPLRDTKRKSPNAAKPNTPEGVSYTLEEDQFAAVLECVAVHRNAVERQPGAGGAAADEEDDHRDRLMLTLNSRFRDATAESFSKLGKTDIRLVVDDDSYLFFECKIWSGPNSIDAALKQLLELYLTYRDRYGVVVLFVRDRVNPAQVPPKAISQIETAHGGKRTKDIAGFPVMEVPVPGGRDRTVKIAVVTIVLDSALPRA